MKEKKNCDILKKTIIKLETRYRGSCYIADGIRKEEEMKKYKNNFKSSGTYISNIVIGKLVFKKNIQIGIGGVFAVLFLYGAIEGLVGQNKELREGVVTYIVMLIPFTLIFIKGIRNGRNLSLVRRYNSIFMCDVDGTVTISELARQTGKPPHKVLSELERLFGMGVFCDCTLQKGGTPCVILSGREGSKTSFVNVVCEKCNGTTRLRAGTSGKCEYCGSAISSRNTGR